MKDTWRLEVFREPPKYMKPAGWALSMHDKEAVGRPFEERLEHAFAVYRRYRGVRISFRLKNRKTQDIIPLDIL